MIFIACIRNRYSSLAPGVYKCTGYVVSHWHRDGNRQPMRSQQRPTVEPHNLMIGFGTWYSGDVRTWVYAPSTPSSTPGSALVISTLSCTRGCSSLPALRGQMHVPLHVIRGEEYSGALSRRTPHPCSMGATINARLSLNRAWRRRLKQVPEPSLSPLSMSPASAVRRMLRYVSS